MNSCWMAAAGWKHPTGKLEETSIHSNREVMRKDVENHWKLRQEVVAAVQKAVRVEAAGASA